MIKYDDINKIYIYIYIYIYTIYNISNINHNLIDFRCDATNTHYGYYYII